MTAAHVTFDEYRELSDTLDACDRFHDERRSEAWLDLFLPDAVYVVHGTRYAGRAELARFLRERRDGAGKHLHAAPLVLGRSGDEVEVECDYVGYRRAPGHIVVGGTGRYRDRLRRTADGWRFVERRVEGALLSDEAITTPRTHDLVGS